MKSKSFHSSHASVDKLEQNRSFDFSNLYKSTAESSPLLPEKSSKHDKESSKTISQSFNNEKPNKRRKEKRECVEISHVTIDGPNLSHAGGSTPLNEPKVTSTPLGASKNHKPTVKSIMKVNSTPGVTDDTMDTSNYEYTYTKSKKRNKSVSFMLEDSEVVTNKKMKSDDSSRYLKKIKSKNHLKKVKKDRQAEKENRIETISYSSKEICDSNNKPKTDKNAEIPDSDIQRVSESSSSVPTIDNNEGKKKRKHMKKAKKADAKELTQSNTNNVPLETPIETVQKTGEKVKKLKKKKHQDKSDPEGEEPVNKSRKTEDQPDVVKDLKKLSIGDNAHTLSNLLDEMTVADREKRKKLKHKLNKNKKPEGLTKPENSETEENPIEKVKKWSKRKWNKDTKADVKEDSLETAVLVENLPLSLLFTYKKILSEHFVKYGLIKSVGIAEVYPTEVSKPVFTTTINFYSEGAATEALKEDKTTLEGSCIRLKRPLPPTETTLVIRSYGPLTPQLLSSMFHGAGRIRNIRHMVKGKHAMATYFIEFDGREATERALNLAADVKVGGKKIYVSKFESRPKKPKPENKNGQASDADHSDDSEA